MEPSTASEIASVAPEVSSRFVRASRALSAFVTSLGVFVLAAWLWGRGPFAAQLLAMKPNTALSFIALGLACWAASNEQSARARKLAASAVLTISGLTAIEHVLGVNLGIDELLFRDLSTSPAHGRMAPMTALNLLGLGLALLSIDTKRRRLGDIATALVAFSALLSVCGYLFGARALHVYGSYSIAPHGAVGFLLACAAVVTATPESGVGRLLTSNTVAGSVMRRLVPAVILLPLTVGWLRLSLQDAGVLDSHVGIAVQVAVNIGILSAVVVIVAGSLHASELRRRRAEELAQRDQLFLLELGEVLREKQAWTDLIYEVSSRLADFLSLTRCSFLEVVPGTDDVRIHHGYHGSLHSLMGVRSLAGFSRETQAYYRAGKTLVVEDAATDSRTAHLYEETYRPMSLRSAVAVPLHRAGEWSALLVASMSTPRKWQEREVHIVRLVAERTWMWVEQLRTLEALKNSEARKAAKLNSAFDGIVTIDHDGKIIEFNPAAERLFGRTRADVIGQSMPELLVPPALREQHQRGFNRYLERGQGPVIGKTVELPAMRADGTEFPAELAITRVVGQEPPIFTAFIRDVSERQRSERERRELLEQLQAANLQLEERVASRTAQLTSTLREREVLLQEVHHRVKNNLQVISSLINMQLRQVAQGPSRRALEECQMRILAIALIHEKLYQSDDYARVPFSEYAEGLAGNIFQATGASRDQIGLDIHMQALSLAVDRAIPCGLILNELITNALKHAFPGGRRGSIRVGLERRGGEVVLSVGDDGVGMPPDLEPLRGKSLGMRLVSVLVEQLDGKLDVARGSGTLFQISFQDNAA